MHVVIDKNNKSSFVNKAYILLEMLANSFLATVQITGLYPLTTAFISLTTKQANWFAPEKT